jgi:hypothetical protein
MKYYKDENNQVFAYEADGSQDGFIDDKLTPISKMAADLIINPPKSMSELKQLKRLEINTAFEQEMQQITGGYPASETSSWAKQETEARAYVANNTAPTPLIDALSISRGIDKAELVSRIIAKADLFATLSGQLIGKRQALEDAVNALPDTATAEDIAAITW